jgi:hypothetical protein
MSNNCELCHKKYASYQSLWIHNKKFHQNNIISAKEIKEIKKNSICSYCDKSFSTKYTLNTHYKSCSIKKFSSINKSSNTLDNTLEYTTFHKYIIKEDTTTNIENQLIQQININDDNLHKYSKKAPDFSPGMNLNYNGTFILIIIKE